MMGKNRVAWVVGIALLICGVLVSCYGRGGGKYAPAYENRQTTSMDTIVPGPVAPLPARGFIGDLPATSAGVPAGELETARHSWSTGNFEAALKSLQQMKRRMKTLPAKHPRIKNLLIDLDHMIARAKKAKKDGRKPDEYLIIERSAKYWDPDDPRGGEMKAKIKDREVPVPLKHTDVKADISLYIGSVEVTQQYHNPFDQKIEAVYVFPLPQNAAVNDFLMKIGDRTIRGIIREKEEAKKIYEEARARGHVASLMTQERPNIFTQKVANIEPGKQIDVSITYYQPIRFRDGEYEFTYPMVVGPRFNPENYTDGVGAVPRGKHGSSGQRTEVEYLRPDEISRNEISFRLRLDAGLAVTKVHSPSHVIVEEKLEGDRVEVRLHPNDRIPNKDFVLRYRLAGKGVRSALALQRTKQDGYFTLLIQPPDNLEDIPAPPREMIFVLDCSGSMSGEPMAAAKRALERCLRRLRPTDTFQIIRFSSSASQLGPRPIAASKKNIRKGLRFAERLNGSGGTRMIEGIKAALDFPHDPDHIRIVTFMTDGYIGNDREIVGEVKRRLGRARVFSFGVGSSPNRYLLERMAKAGNGVAAYVRLDEASDRVVDALYNQLEHPALTDIEIDWGAMQVKEVYPRRIPDLLVGRPIVVTGRFSGQGRAEIRIRGRAGEKQTFRMNVDLDNPASKHSAIASLWARHKIMDCFDVLVSDRNDSSVREMEGVILATALKFNLLSQFTAFVAVDSASKTKGEEGTSVKQPVPVPDGVKYKTTVKEEKD